MPAVQSVTIVGAGFAGCASAILLAQAGIKVDLIDQNPEIVRRGSGITLQGNALRVLRQLGVWEQILAQGYPFNTVGFRAPDPDGTLLAEVPDARTGGPDLPATLGMPRAALASSLLQRARDVGVRVQLGVKYLGFTQHASGVDTLLDNGSTIRSDLLVGADGVRSHVRQDLGLDSAIVPIGMGIWRMFLPRPSAIDHTDLIYGGPSYIAGYCPTSEDTLYAYIVEPFDAASADLGHEAGVARMLELSRAYHGPWDDLRPFITNDRYLNYAVFESHVVEQEWGEGRVVIMGDAAHSCPPTLAQGAAQALEDAAVLAELIVQADEFTEALVHDYSDRRRDRAKAVVTASVQLCDWLLEGDTHADVPGLLRQISTLVGQPA